MDQESGNPDQIIHSETFNKFIEEDLGLDSEDLAILRELCNFSDEVEEVNIRDIQLERVEEL